jgi:AmiR/NasT family two-component response regulator
VTRPLIQNFRGVRALVLHGQDRNRAVLAETLTKLGLRIEVVDPMDRPCAIRAAVKEAEIILFDADLAEEIAAPWAAERIVAPVIALVGLEAPGRLLRAFELEPCAVLYKPLRSTGIYSALFFAANEHRRRAELVAKLALLEERHRGRRFVTRAIVRLMQERGIDDDQAYRLLRKESMRRRLTIEECAAQLIAAGEGAAARQAREA